jgi:hypothetical protein
MQEPMERQRAEAGRISCVTDAGITREGGSSSEVKTSKMTRAAGREYPEKTAMWPSWNMLSAWGTYVMWAALVAMASFVSACTVPSHLGPNPSAMPSDGG